MLSIYPATITLGAALLTLGLSACGTLSKQQIDTPDSLRQEGANPGDLRAQVDALAQPLIDRKRTPGIVIGVLSADGRKQVFGYGVSDFLSGTRPDGETLFAVGSLSKGLVGNLTAMLVQDGLLGWDDDLEQLLPVGTPLSEDARAITLLQLATHSAGLPRQPMTPRTLGYFIEYLFTGNSFYRHFDQAYLLDYLADFSKPRQVAPQYSNIGYALLSHVLELRSGKNIDELAAERILDPLQLSNTSYQPQQLAGYAERARGHAGDQPKFVRRGRPVPDWQFSDILHGSAALYSNADDLLDYAAAHLHGSGDAQRDAALRDSLRVRLERPREAPAIAWMVDTIHGQRLTYQVGLVAGYSSYLGLDTRHKTAVVVLQNSFNWSNGIGHRLLLRMAHNLDRQRELASVPTP
ncbi:MAG: serine hydrolase domain-containing protein [Pseudomonas sp.]|uniref:serine hydrolase domain-containing protein n=1 Tax=Pseudomonas sp. TaxID=306 RepID=UPI00299DBD65|nr:serine hydrolase domain-containing protein [Pseudomonas sp.]MDX1722137.1 serine hydrolase domain-containing protein [Pseudomonas sp.]